MIRLIKISTNTIYYDVITLKIIVRKLNSELFFLLLLKLLLMKVLVKNIELYKCGQKLTWDDLYRNTPWHKLMFHEILPCGSK